MELHTVVPIPSRLSPSNVEANDVALQTPRSMASAATPRGLIRASKRVLFNRGRPGISSPGSPDTPRGAEPLQRGPSSSTPRPRAASSTAPADVADFLQRQRLCRQKHEKLFQQLRQDWMEQRQPILETLARDQDAIRLQLKELQGYAERRRAQVQSLSEVLQTLRSAHMKETASKRSSMASAPPESTDQLDADIGSRSNSKEMPVLEEREVLTSETPSASAMLVPWENQTLSPAGVLIDTVNDDEAREGFCGCGMSAYYSKAANTKGLPIQCSWCSSSSMLSHKDAVLSERQPIWHNPPIPWEGPGPAVPSSAEAIILPAPDSSAEEAAHKLKECPDNLMQAAPSSNEAQSHSRIDSGTVGEVEGEAEVLLMGQEQSLRTESDGDATTYNRALSDRSPSNLSLMSMASSDPSVQPQRAHHSTVEEKTRCWKIVHNPLFEGFCVSIIVVHAAVMGFVGNISVQNSGKEREFEIVEICFLMWYLFELSLKFYVHGWGFVRGEESRWNIFDIICVIPVNQIYDAIADSSQLSTSFLRALRLLRLVKVLRLIRVMRFFRELRLLLSMLVGSLSMLMWTLAMLVLILYIFGIIFLQALDGYLSQESVQNHFLTGEGSMLDHRHEALLEHWGGIYKCMLTLYKSITGGHDWAYVAEPLKATGFQYYIIFMIYIIFLVLAVLNILTGMFCERAKKVVQQDSHTAIMEAIRADDTYREDVKRLFAQLDVDGNGGVTWEEFHDELQKPAVQAYFESLDIEIRHAERLFKALAGADDSRLSAEDFLQGCLKIHGDVRRQDMLALMKQVQTYILQSQCFMRFVDDSMQKLHAHGTSTLPRASRTSSSAPSNTLQMSERSLLPVGSTPPDLGSSSPAPEDE